MKKKRFIDISTCICQECGFKMPIPRCHGQKRGRNHIKDIWCPRCGKETKFLEVRSGDCYINGNEILY